MKRIAQVFRCLLLFLIIAIPSFATTFDDVMKSAFKAGDFNKMQSLCTADENKDNPRAQYWLGAIYETGTGVTQDFKEAAKWYLLAAEKGDTDSQKSVAGMYENGSGITKDVEEALKWYRKAALGGDLGAQSILGGIYSEGKNVQQNQTESFHWYRMAAENINKKGYENASTSAAIRLSYLFSNGIGVKRDDNEANNWLKIASKYGETSALILEGDIFFPESSLPVDMLANYPNKSNPQNIKMALELYKIAAERGDIKTMTRLGEIYNEGRGIPKNYTEAIKWFSKAAILHDIDAQNKLGDLYRDGLGVPQNYRKAIELYRQAEKQGDDSAKDRIAHMYEKGYGVPKNLKEAVKTYEVLAHKANKKIKSGTITTGTEVSKITLSLRQCIIGIHYYNGGTGLAKDFIKAYAWFSLSAANGYEKSQEYMVNLGQEMNQSQISKAQKLAKVLWAK